MSVADAAAEAPSAELLLYLAEFADEDGKPEDPLTLEPDHEAEAEAEPDTAPPTTAKPDDAKADAKPAANDR